MKFPAAAQTFIREYFPESTVSYVKKDKEPYGFEAKFSYFTSPSISLTFTPTPMNFSP